MALEQLNDDRTGLRPGRLLPGILEPPTQSCYRIANPIP